MKASNSLWAAVQGDANAMMALHKWLTIVWLLAALPICVFLKDSLPFLVFVSVYAVVTGHWATFQAARVEVRQEEIEEEREKREG